MDMDVSSVHRLLMFPTGKRSHNEDLSNIGWGYFYLLHQKKWDLVVIKHSCKSKGDLNSLNVTSGMYLKFDMLAIIPFEDIKDRSLEEVNSIVQELYR